MHDFTCTTLYYISEASGHPKLESITATNITEHSFQMLLPNGMGVLKKWKTPFGQSCKPTALEAWDHFLCEQYYPVLAAHKRAKEAEARFKRLKIAAEAANGAEWTNQALEGMKARETATMERNSRI